MPRDGSGNYTLPAGNPVVPGTLIEASWANPTLEDIAIALTNSLSRNGNGGMLAPLGFIDGSISTPGMFFNSQTNMGLHRFALDDMRIVMNGASSLQITDTFVNVQVPELQVQTIPVLLSQGDQDIDGAITIIADNAIGLDIDRPTAGSAGFQIRNDEGGVRFVADDGNFDIQQIAANGTLEDSWIRCEQNAGVILFYDDSQKFATTNDGIAVTGSGIFSGDITGDQIYWGAGDHKLFNNDGSGNAGQTFGADGDTATEDGRPYRVVVANDSNTGNYDIQQADSSVTQGGTITWRSAIEILAPNGDVALKYGGNNRLTTESSGVDITGTMESSGDAVANGVNLNSAISALEAFVNDFVVTASNKGRIRIPYSTSNAILIQWGQVSGIGVSGDTTDNFVESFTDVYQAVATGEDNNVNIETLTNSQINFGNVATSNSARYIAIGRRSI